MGNARAIGPTTRSFTSTIGGVRVRAKLVVHFADLHPFRDPNIPTDMAESLARSAIAEYATPEAAMGAEAIIADQVLRGLPSSARVGRVEICVALPDAFTTSQRRRVQLTSGRGERGRVLLVEDDPACRATLVALLSDEFDVVAAAGPSTARSEMSSRSGRFDVVLTDYEMPDEDGMSLLCSMLEEHSHLIGILVTAHEKYAQVASTRSDDTFFRILLKPYDPELLLASVRGALSLARMRTTAAKLTSLSS